MKSSSSIKRKTILFLVLVNLTAWTSGARTISASAFPPALAITPATPSKDDASKARVDWALKSQPVSFIENRGQIDPEVAYYIEGMGTRLYFTSRGITFSVPQRKPGSDLSQPANRWNVAMDFAGARKNARPAGEEAIPTRFSYFRGQKDQWKTGVHAFSRVAYRDLWPGIDLIYSGGINEVKYEYLVKPGADPSLIQLAYRGGNISLDPKGNLRIGTPEGGLIDKQPYSYQEGTDGRNAVATDFQIRRTTESETTRCGFRVGSYDHSKTLVIDPQTTAYSGFIAGQFVTVVFGIAVDSMGAAYVTGYTESDQTSFPVTVGPGLNFNENKSFLFWTCFVAKISPSGSSLEYCGYIDGAGHQAGTAIAIDNTGAAYVTGFTTSDQTTFPINVGPKLAYAGDFDGPSPNGYLGDAFVAKVKPDGSGLDYCGYIGGSGDDAAYGIAVDSNGNAYVTGQTTSAGPSQVSGITVPFPVSVGPSLTNPNAPSTGLPDAFIVEVKSDGSGFVYGGFIGGAGLNLGLGVAVDSTGAAYLTGLTNAPQSGFPQLTVGPSLTFGGGESDAFVAKVKPGGAGLVYCGYIGGSNGDEGFGIAVDSAGNAYVTGETASDQTTFPVKGGPSLTFGGAESIENGFQTDGVGTVGPPELLTLGDAFVAKVNPTGSGLVYCGYIGGAGGDAGYRIAVDSVGSAIITGSTNSSPSTFPVTAATGQFATYSGGTVFGDAFIAKVMPSGEGLLYAGYLGGTQDDSGVAVAVDSNDDVYVAGGTISPNFPVVVGPSLTFVSEFMNPAEPDAFVAKITGLPAGQPPPPPTPDFSLSLSQASITAQLGTKVSETIDVTELNGFTGKVTISGPSSLPTGIKVSGLPIKSKKGNGVSVTIKVKGTASAGTDQIVFTGTSGSLSHTTTLSLTVQ